MKKKTLTYFWIAIYFLMVFLPLVLLMILPRPEGREFLREVAVALGFLAMALLGLQTIPTSRLKFFTRAFPMDTLYTFHHKLSVFTFVIAFVHPVLLIINNPVVLRLLNVFTAPWRARAGVASVVAMLILIVTSVWRKQINLKYHIWRWLHDVASFLAIGLALFHMFKVNHYLELPYQRVLWLVLTGIWVAIILYIRVARPIIMINHPYTVVGLEQERGECWSLTLKPEGHKGFDFHAGQFAWITTESPWIFKENPFSFSNDADHKDNLISFTIKELGDFTNNIKDIKPGQTIYVDGPYGTFSLDDHLCKDLVLIAGGIGSAPVMSMLRTLASRGDKRQVTFFYGNPTWDSIIYREELEELEKQLNLNLVHVIERPLEDWDGEKGFVTEALLKRHLPENFQDQTYFMCGPLPMIEAVDPALRKLGVPASHIFSEQYEMA